MRRIIKYLGISAVSAVLVLNILLLFVVYFDVHSPSQRSRTNRGKNHLEDATVSDVEIINAYRKDSLTTRYKIVDHKTFRYQNFNITEPQFISTRHRTMFHAKSANNDIVGVPASEKLTGQIYIIRNGSFGLPYDCGYRSNISDILQYRAVSVFRKYRSVMPLIVPDGGTFQHFLDGVLPKIIQALDYIKNPQVKLVLTPIRDHIIFEMLAKLNISKNRISFYTGSFSADYLVLTCITPPLHPVLWQTTRYLLGASEILMVPENETKIVIVTRDGCRNCDRNLLNINALVLELQAKYTYERVNIFRGPYDLNSTLELFSKTKVVIGTHGGGLYNVNFCPKGTVVIEIMPTYSDGKTVAAADTIIWTQSVLLGHKYWRLPTAPVNYLGDVVVNITLVKNILDKSDLKL